MAPYDGIVDNDVEPEESMNKSDICAKRPNFLTSSGTIQQYVIRPKEAMLMLNVN